MNRNKKNLGLLLAGIFINRFGSFVAIFLVLYLLSKGFTPIQAGLAVSIFGAGNIGASVVGGYLADLLGRRNTIVVSMFFSSASMLLLSQVFFLPALLTCVGLAGFTSALFRPAAGALIADLTPENRLVRTYALYRLALNLGAAAGPAVAAFLASRSFFLLFMGDALTSILFGLLALFTLPNNRTSLLSVHKTEHTQNERVFLRDRRFLLFLGASLLMALVYYQVDSTFALQVKAFGLSNAIYGLLLSLNGLIIIVLELPLSTITQRFSVRPVIALGIVLIGLGFGLTAFAPTFFLLAGTVMIWTLGEIVYHAPAASYVASLAPEKFQGRYQGIFDSIWSIAMCVSPLIGTFAFVWNAQVFWLICGGIVILSGVSWLLLSQQKKPVLVNQERHVPEENELLAQEAS